MDSFAVLHMPFDTATHKATFTNYLEVIITVDGTVEYAVPSHQEKLIQLAMQSLGISREKLYQLCPQEYWFNFMPWLCEQSGAIAVWNSSYIGTISEPQRNVLMMLKSEGLYQGNI